MKPSSLLAFLAGASLVVSVGFGANAQAQAATGGVSPAGPFNPLDLTPEYRVVIKLDAKAFTAFHKPSDRAAIAASTVSASGPKAPLVLARFNELRLTGVIPSTPNHPGLIILGGEIYKEGDEMLLRDTKTRRPSPFVPDHKVVLRSVTHQVIELGIGLIGQPKLDSLPIDLMEFRQR